MMTTGRNYLLSMAAVGAEVMRAQTRTVLAAEGASDTDKLADVDGKYAAAPLPLVYDALHAWRQGDARP